MLARTAAHFGMQVLYTSRTRKAALEDENLQFRTLDELVSSCEIVSIHVPRNTLVLGEREFHLKRQNSVLVNTSLGVTFDKDAFVSWLERDQTSCAILDADGAAPFADDFGRLDNVLLTQVSAGFTAAGSRRSSP